MDTPEIDALQNELGSLTCEEQKPSQLKKLPPWENVYHAITMMPAYRGKSFEELRLEAYQATAMSGEGLRAANAAFAALAAERDRLVFRAPSPVAALCVTPDKPFVFGASVAEPRAVTPGKKPFVFGASR